VAKKSKSELKKAIDEADKKLEPVVRELLASDVLLDSKYDFERGHRQFANQSIRNYITIIVVVFFCVTFSYPDAWYGLLFRFSYLIAAGVGTWFVLRRVWKSWLPDPNAQYKFDLLVIGATAGILVTLMVQEMTAETHLDNTEWIRVGVNEREPAGEWYEAEGPDIMKSFLWGVLLVFVYIVYTNAGSLNDYVRYDEEAKGQYFEKFLKDNEGADDEDT